MINGTTLSRSQQCIPASVYPLFVTKVIRKSAPKELYYRFDMTHVRVTYVIRREKGQGVQVSRNGGS